MTSCKRPGFSPFTTKLAGVVALALASFGGTRIASARGVGRERGIVEARGPVAKIVAAGPIAFHAYSEFAGGSLYAARAITGTDRDCQEPSTGATKVQADRIANFTVAEGKVACLSTTTKGSFELLWHAVGQPAPTVVLAKASR
jgi:hypothetical protein